MTPLIGLSSKLKLYQQTSVRSSQVAAALALIQKVAARHHIGARRYQIEDVSDKPDDLSGQTRPSSGWMT